MKPLTDVIPHLALYEPALLALALLCLVILIQALLTAPLAFANNEQVPGEPLKGDHSLRSFRVVRTHANTVENLSAIGFTILVAILVGLNPKLVNWLAGIHLVSRLGFWLAYYSGVGKVAGGPRTLCFIGGLATNFVLVAACILALIR